LIEDEAQGGFYPIPVEVQDLLKNNSELVHAWNLLTKKAQNEWVSWIISAKKTETRSRHLQRFSEEVLSGGAQPCWWVGCLHMNTNTKKYFSKWRHSNLSTSTQIKCG